MIITYELENSLYINLTNRCSNACEFCLRSSQKGEDILDSKRWQTSADLSGTNELWLDREPTVDVIIDDLKRRNLAKYNEVVFCGFGEPFMRFDDCKEVAKWLKTQNIKIRVNTNGQANLINNRDVTTEMVGLFDTVSISLNNKNAEEYENLCHSDYGTEAYNELLCFGEKCAKLGMDVVFTVVDILPAEDIEACKILANSRGAKLRIRKYIL